MAVPEQTPYIEHTGNGVTTSFSLGFQCESKDHLIVLVDDIEPPIATWNLTGGNVVFATAPATGKKITLQRNTPFNRTTDYQSFNNSFRPPAVNKDFDWIWWKLQELGVADWILGNRIDALKNYVDRKDDELKAYLMEEIRKQGVALDQLDEYYNYLMERLAQIAVDKGWDASFVVYNSENLKTVLDKQALVNENQSKRNMDAPTFKDYGAPGLNTLIPVSDLYTVGSVVHNPSKFKNLADVKLVYPDVTSATDSLDWAAIQKALKNRAGKDVQSRGGKFIINRKLVFNSPVHIIGDFENGPIYYTSEVTDAALSFEPTYKGARNAYLSQLHIRPQGDLATSPADAFRAVSNSTGGLNHLIIDKCDFRALGGGRAINLMNESANINNDGTALIYIGRNTLLGGIRAPNLGDSCAIYWNNIKGKNIGIEGSLVNAGLGSASSLIIEKNNIVNDNGAIKLSNIRNTHILHNNIEQLVALNLADDRHTVELDGDIQSSYNTVMFNKIAPSDPNKYCGGIKLRNIDGGAVKFNQISSSAVLDGSFNPVGRTDCIKLIGCKDLDIGPNKLYISSGCNGVYIDPTSSNIKGVEDQSYRFFSAGNSTKTIDESTATLHVWRSIANANAIAANAQSTTLQAKLLNGVVHLRGNIKPSAGTGFTADMQIGQLPASMRPVQDTYFIQSWINTGGTRNFCQVRIALDGSIRIPILLADVAAVYISFSFAV